MARRGLRLFVWFSSSLLVGCVPRVVFDAGEAGHAESGADAHDAVPDQAADAAPDAIELDAEQIDVQTLDASTCDAGPACSATARLLAPLSGSVLAGRAALRFTLGGGADGGVLRLCRDRDMTSMCQTVSATPSGYDATGLVPGAWFWNVRATTGGVPSDLISPTWEFFVPASVHTPSGVVLTTVADFNGDGSGDATFGTNLDDHIAYAYGTDAGFDPTVEGIAIAPGRNNNANSVLAHCDTNGDGYVDAIVGSPEGNGTAGAVTVLLGATAGLGSATQLNLGSAAGDRAGWSVACIGDVNGDGYGDIAVGAPYANAMRGAVSVFHGPLSSASRGMAVTLPADASSGQFGRGVVGGADFDAPPDGRLDLLIAEPLYGTTVGRVHVYRGNGDGTFTSVSAYTENVTDRYTGSTIALVGDIDGDGRIDYAIDSPGTSGGRVHVVLSSGGPIDLPGVAQYGAALAAIDIDTNGYWDLVIGSPADTGGGAAYFCAGPSLASCTARAPSGSLRAGSSLMYAGDIDGNGSDDLLVGIPGFNSNVGEVVVFSAGMSIPAGSTATYPALTGAMSFGSVMSR